MSFIPCSKSKLDYVSKIFRTERPWLRCSRVWRERLFSLCCPLKTSSLSKCHLPVIFCLYVISVTDLACLNLWQSFWMQILSAVVSIYLQVVGIIFKHLLCNLPRSSFTASLSCNVSLYVVWSQCKCVTVIDGHFFSMQETPGELPVFL